MFALLALGCGLAAAAASTGGFLEADREVAPFTIFRRPPRRRTPPPDQELTNLDRLTNVVDLLFQSILLMVVAAVVVWLLHAFVQGLLELYRMRIVKTPESATPPYDPGEESREDAETKLRMRVAEELRLLSADLDEHVEPREAVIACYVRMEAGLASVGAGRDATETPLELLRRVLDAYDVPAADVRRLTDLFVHARFSPHPVTDEMRAAARRSLDAVSDALAVRA